MSKVFLFVDTLIIGEWSFQSNVSHSVQHCSSLNKDNLQWHLLFCNVYTSINSIMVFIHSFLLIIDLRVKIFWLSRQKVWLWTLCAQKMNVSDLQQIRVQIWDITASGPVAHPLLINRHNLMVYEIMSRL